jgi:hypothetical protein
VVLEIDGAELQASAEPPAVDDLGASRMAGM